MSERMITADDAALMIGNDSFNVVEQRLAHTVVQQTEQIAALRAGLEWVQGEHSRNPWNPDQIFPTEASRNWHDGYITCAAHQAIEVVKFIDPERYSCERDEWRRLNSDTDEEYYRRTGHCGACGVVASSCDCDGKCGCSEAHGPALRPYKSPITQLAEQAEQLAAVRSLASNLRKAEAKMRAAKGSTIGRQWHESEQARLFGEAAEQIERALGVES